MTPGATPSEAGKPAMGPGNIDELWRRGARAARRARWVHLAEGAPIILALVAAAATLAVWALKLSRPELAMALCLAAGVVATVAIAAVLFRKQPPDQGLRALDFHHQLSDRLRTAAWLRRAEVAGRALTPWESAALHDGVARAPTLDVAGAVPWPRMRYLWVTPLLLAAAVFSWWVPIRPAAPVTPVATDVEPRVHVDTEALDSLDRSLGIKDPSPLALSAAKELSQVVEEIRDSKLGQEEAFRRLRTIEESIDAASQVERERLRGLDRLGKTLAATRELADAGSSLSKGNLAKARADLQALAKALREQAVSPEAKKRLEEALAKASRVQTEALKAVEMRRAALAEERDRLTQMAATQKGNAGSPGAARDGAAAKERQLERLTRETEEEKRINRELERLQRELAEAAEHMMRDAGLTASDFEDMASDLERFENESTSLEEKKKLKEQLEALRDLLRESAKDPSQAKREFSKRAKGGKGGQPGKKGPQHGDSGPGGTMPGLGERAIPLPIKRPSAETSGAPGDGPSAGEGSDPNLRGDATEAMRPNALVATSGIDNEEGVTHSQAIERAASEGFSSSAYARVYREYESVVQERIDKENIPVGAKSYVKKYFDLIRPRGAKGEP